MSMKLFVYIVTTFAVLQLTGCASVPMASMDQDSKAKEFTVPKDRASLYIYRNENFGGAIPMTVSVNDRILGQSAAKTYFKLNLGPGLYNVASTTENTSTLPITISAGNNYFVWQEVKMGVWMARSELHQVDEQTGRAGVLESKLAVSNISGNDLVPIGNSTVNLTNNDSAQPPHAPSNSTSGKLRELDSLHKSGVITDEDYENKKKDLLKQF